MNEFDYEIYRLFGFRLVKKLKNVCSMFQFCFPFYILKSLDFRDQICKLSTLIHFLGLRNSSQSFLILIRVNYSSRGL